MNIIKRLYIFQNERFPIKILAFTTGATVLGSIAVSSSQPGRYIIAMAFISTLLYLFHIRVIDEDRDLKLDNSLHPDRPVQRGIVSINQLFLLDLTGLLICVAISIFIGTKAIIVTLAILVFTSLAWKDFFAPNYFKNRPVIYHLVNSPQMVLIQWNIYAIYTKSLHINWSMILFLLLVYNGIFIIEIIRKTNISIADTPDSYSSQIGVKKSIYLAAAMLVSGLIIFFLLLFSLGKFQCVFVFAGLAISILTSIVYLLFIKINNTKFQKLMIPTTVIYFVTMNLFIWMTSLSWC